MKAAPSILEPTGLQPSRRGPLAYLFVSFWSAPSLTRLAHGRRRLTAPLGFSSLLEGDRAVGVHFLR